MPLAIERESVSAAVLRANLVPQETSRAFLEALRALQQRSLLETAGDGFTLQNVLIEYMTERLIAGVCAELTVGPDALSGGQNDKVNDDLPGSGARMLHGHTDDVTGVAFSHDGRVLVSSSNDHTLRLWAVERGELLQSLAGHTAAITTVAFSPDGARIASIEYDSMVRMWDVATGRSSTGWGEIRAGSRVVAFSPRGDVLAHGAEEVQLVVRDARTGTIIHRLQGHTSTIVGLHWSPTESILASSG
jgi:WD40 repeat protein